MYWGHGYGMAWGWVGAFLALLALAALIVLVVRSFTAGAPPGTPPRTPPGAPPGPQPPSYGQILPPRSNARAILDERLARGEVTPDEYREIRRALDETAPPGY